jgi:hypothetical protein
LDLFQIRFWPFMADTFVDVVLYGHAYVSGDTLYAYLYPSTGEHVSFESIDSATLDQSIRDLYDYPSGARRVHHYRMKLEVYIGVPPLAFFCSNSARLKPGKDRIRQIVNTYRKAKSLPCRGTSRAELKEMVCHDDR